MIIIQLNRKTFSRQKMNQGLLDSTTNALPTELSRTNLANTIHPENILKSASSLIYESAQQGVPDKLSGTEFLHIYTYISYAGLPKVFG